MLGDSKPVVTIDLCSRCDPVLWRVMAADGPPYIALVFSHFTRCREGVTVAFSAVVVVVPVVEGNQGGAKLGFDV
jgi:hypothetical protein